MKKIFLAALAIAAIASCTKNEVVSVIENNQEITYQTVIGPVTKALGTGEVAFDTGNKFYAYAFFLPKDNNWSTNYASSSPYITSSLIGYYDEIWKHETNVYYWPKQGSLTFFAWTDNTGNPSLSGSTTAVLCANNTGIQVVDYSITDNPNKDLMVAAVAQDKTQNATTYIKKGVPTLFSHILSQLEFYVKTDKDYSSSATFALKSLNLKNVYVDGDYTQGSPTASVNPWDDYTTTTNIPVYNPASPTEVTLTSGTTALAPNTGDYYIVLPQTFTDATPVIEVVYTITTNYTGTDVVETVTVEKDLKTIYTDWEPGKTHQLTITLSLNEILWDPATVDWVTDDTPAVTL